MKYLQIYIVRDICKSMPDILSRLGGGGVRTGGMHPLNISYNLRIYFGGGGRERDCSSGAENKAPAHPPPLKVMAPPQ